MDRRSKLRRAAVAGALLVAGLILGAATARADGRPGHGGGHYSHVDGHVGVGVYFPSWSFYYPYGPSWYPGWPYYGAPYSPYYYPPFYAYPPAVVPVPSSPPTYVERPGQSPVEGGQRYWYWCNDPRGYYPSVRECPGGWTPVAPQPARPQ